MATKLYLHSTPAVEPKPNTKQCYHSISQWVSSTLGGGQDSASAIYPLQMNTVPGSSLTTTISESITETGAAHYVWFKSWVSPRLAGAQTISGYVRCEWDTNEGNSQHNMYPELELYVWKSDDSGLRGTLATWGGAVESDTTDATLQTFLASASLTTVNAQDGDRIYAEITAYDNNTKTSAYTHALNFDGAVGSNRESYINFESVDLVFYSTSRDLPGNLVIPSGAQTSSRDLLGSLVARQTTYRDLPGRLIARQTSTRDLLGLLRVALLASRDLEGVIVARESGQSDLQGLVFALGVGNRDLPGLLVSRREGVKDLPGQIVASYFSEKELPGLLTLMRESLKDVPATLVSRQIAQKDLLATLVSRQTSGRDLLGSIVSRWSSQADLPGLLVSSPSSIRDLMGVALVRQASARDLAGCLVSRRESWRDLPGLIDVVTGAIPSVHDLSGLLTVKQQSFPELSGKLLLQRLSGGDLPGYLLVSLPGEADLPGRLVISAATLRDLQAKIYVQVWPVVLDLDGKLVVIPRYLGGHAVCPKCGGFLHITRLWESARPGLLRSDYELVRWRGGKPEKKPAKELYVMFCKDCGHLFRSRQRTYLELLAS